MFDRSELEIASSVYSHMCLHCSCLGVSVHKCSKPQLSTPDRARNPDEGHKMFALETKTAIEKLQRRGGHKSSQVEDGG